MGDRITTYNDCPKCGAKGTFECYEALSSEMKFDQCEVCDYKVNYDFEEKDGIVNITKINPMSHNNSLREQIIDVLHIGQVFVNSTDYSDESVAKMLREKMYGKYADAILALILADRERAVVEELQNFSKPDCICNEMGTKECDSYWHHQNAIDDRIGSLTDKKEGK